MVKLLVTIFIYLVHTCIQAGRIDDIHIYITKFIIVKLSSNIMMTKNEQPVVLHCPHN
jgi:hypothetical protein